MPLKMLITGKDSFVGSSVERYLAGFAGQYQIDTLDMRAESWRDHDFSAYDSVLHVAGIAHVSPDPAMTPAYMRVNRDLAIETARVAKRGGARQFIFMSSVIVYGASAAVGRSGRIDQNSETRPENAYGESKLQAENGIRALEDDSFRVVILRPPMIYGPGCKGNYNALVSFARKLPIFPALANERGALYIENLAEFIRLMLENRESGTFTPQNREIVRTGDFVREIAAAHGRKVCLTHAFDPALKLLGKRGLVRRAFGSCAYLPEMTDYPQDYRIVDFHQSILKTEKGGV